MNGKICIICGLAKPRSEFYCCSTTADKRTDKCKACYIAEKEAKLAAKQKEKKIIEKHLTPRVITGVPGVWASCQKVSCPSPTSKCWLSYQKALCCCECLGYEACENPNKCINKVNECMKWYRGIKK